MLTCVPANDSLKIFHVLVLMHLSGGESIDKNPGKSFEQRELDALAILFFSCSFYVLRLEQQLEFRNSESIFLIGNK